MNSAEIKLIHRVWMLLNRKNVVTPARLTKLIKKEPAMHVIKRLEDAYGVTIEKTNSGYHMKETEAVTPPVKKTVRAAAKKRA